MKLKKTKCAVCKKRMHTRQATEQELAPGQPCYSTPFESVDRKRGIVITPAGDVKNDELVCHPCQGVGGYTC